MNVAAVLKYLTRIEKKKKKSANYHTILFSYFFKSSRH